MKKFVWIFENHLRMHNISEWPIVNSTVRERLKEFRKDSEKDREIVSLQSEVKQLNV